jgi:hypothetical protein
MAKMKSLFTLVTAALSLLPAIAEAHSARATLDANGTRAAFTALARVTCFDDGSGLPAALQARVRDNSPPVAGLLVSVQVIRGTQALSASDTTSGDAGYSETLLLNGGAGVYTVLLNKTAAGARNFDFEWHCLTAKGEHTGTDIIVDQFK